MWERKLTSLSFKNVIVDTVLLCRVPESFVTVVPVLVTLFTERVCVTCEPV